VYPQRDGRFYVGFAPKVGRVNGPLLSKIADVAEEHGSARIRTTTEQKLLILDLAEDQVEPLVTAMEALGFAARPSTFRRQTMHCTGIEYCKLAIVKLRPEQCGHRLRASAADCAEPLIINVNGCPNSCARSIADIGLGSDRHRSEGRQVEGFQVHLGGAPGVSRIGRKLRSLVTAEEVPDYIERVVRRLPPNAERRALRGLAPAPRRRLT
jgi:sulfite reductase (ferredoxin)